MKNGMRPVHPGEILLEDYLKPKGLTTDALADCLLLPRNLCKNICEGKQDIDADIAIRLCIALGSDPVSWLRLQTTYNLKIEMMHEQSNKIRAHIKRL